MPIGCVLFLFYYLCSEFLEIILKEMRGLAIIFRFFMLLVLLLPVVALCPVKAETTSEGPILIVTSYNPETRSISDNLSAFMDEYRQRGGKYTPIIESMNCKNLSEAYLWKSRMASILGKYKGKNRPSLVILLGQEAWSAYISQDTEIAKRLRLSVAWSVSTDWYCPMIVSTRGYGNLKVRIFIRISVIIILLPVMYMNMMSIKT